MAKIPDILWYQDKANVYLSYQILCATEVKITFDKRSVCFSAKDKETEYSVTVELSNDIDPEKSSWKTLGREVNVRLCKAEADRWVRLQKEGKPRYIKSNWAHPMYDSDDDNDMGGFGNDNFDPGNMNFDSYGGDEGPSSSEDEAEEEEDKEDSKEEDECGRGVCDHKGKKDCCCEDQGDCAGHADKCCDEGKCGENKCSTHA